MGRVKIQMKQIVDRLQRNIAFAKRKSGLLKKAYEIATLCDVPVLLVMFSPSGKLFLFEAKTRIEETLQKYLDMGCYVSGRHPVPDEPFVRRWIQQMRVESQYRGDSRENRDDDGVRYQTRSKTIENAIDDCNVKLANVEQQLGYFLKNPNQWKSRDEVDFQENLLQNTLEQVRSRKQLLEVESKAFDALGSPPQTSFKISSVE